MPTKPRIFSIIWAQNPMIVSSICKWMSITVFLIGVYITCKASFSWTWTWWILLLGIDFTSLYSFFRPCFEDHILSIVTLIRNLWPNIRTWTPLMCNLFTFNNLPKIFAKVYLFKERIFDTYMVTNTLS